MRISTDAVASNARAIRAHIPEGVRMIGLTVIIAGTAAVLRPRKEEAE